MRIRITCYVQTQACSGFVNLLDNERLSDLLNKRFTNSLDDNNGFLQISDATMTLSDGSKDRLPDACINKAAIQFASIQEGDLARGLGVGVGPKSYPFIEKSPVRVRLRLPGCELVGNVHCTKGQTAYSLLKEKLKFLPLTQVKILTPDMANRWSASFAAVNRAQILVFREEDALGLS